ncbi:peptidyl-prolyl cis-trans isomerase, putative [Medicago truncatula]|uniref:Peptidyl-prolyl cis-trans isomerase, putative n=1 Tax=Medicago truncatula TaxID=3880 RepID=G7IXT0_MEDTR|nr:peptidyl-prolyl cis-trans isomerase, putative [Medicago truncatula]
MFWNIITTGQNKGMKCWNVTKGEGPESRDGDLVEFNYVCRHADGYFVFSGETNPDILPLDENQVMEGNAGKVDPLKNKLLLSKLQCCTTAVPDTASDAVIFNRLQNLDNSKVWQQKNYTVWNDSIETENQVELCEIHLLDEWHLVQQVSTGQHQSMQHATDVVWKIIVREFQM